MDLSPEWKLLLACARTNVCAEHLQRVEDLADSGLDWGHVANTACAHGIAPLIYHSLHRSGVASLLPPAAAEKLRNSYYGNAARNALLYNELWEVLTALRKQRADVIVLKGAALAESVYPNRALRPMSDIDLLVRKEKVAEAQDRLIELGYRLQEGGDHYHFVFTKRSAVSVEIHWHIQRPTAPFKIDIDDLWERAQPASVAGVDALVFSPEDLLLHLCQHACKHELFGGIRPLCDIAQAVSFYADQIDWKKVAALSTEWQMNPPLHLVLRLAGELLDAPVPESFLQAIKPVDFNAEVIRWARKRLLAHGESSPVFPDLLQLFWKGRCFKERLAVLQRVLSPNARSTCYPYPSVSKRVYFYYPLRLKYLLTRYTPVVWSLVSGNQKIRAAAEWEDNQQRLTKWLSTPNDFP